MKSTTPPTLLSGEYVLAVREAAAKVKGTVAKNIIRTLAYDYSGETHERNLMAECSKNSWGKTRQYLVDSKVIKYDEVSKLIRISGQIWEKTGSNLGNFGCNVNVNVNNLPKDTLKRLTSGVSKFSRRFPCVFPLF